MFTDGFLQHNLQELELEMERRCLVLNLKCADEHQVQQFARDVFQNMGKLNEAATHGDALARTKMELYSLSMLMHKSLFEMYGPNYISSFDDLSVQKAAWAALARAFWRELENRENKNE
jgi:hypothetical protein